MLIHAFISSGLDQYCSTIITVLRFAKLGLPVKPFENVTVMKGYTNKTCLT